MRSYELKRLSTSKQASYVCKHGTFLIDHKWKDIQFILFSLDNFFVEFYYDTIKKDLIGIRSFDSENCPHEYLEKIDMQKLAVQVKEMKD